MAKARRTVSGGRNSERRNRADSKIKAGYTMKSKMTEIHGSDKYDKAVDYSVDRAIKLKKKKKKEASGQLKRKLVAAINKNLKKDKRY